MTDVRLDGVSKDFGGGRVVADLDLAIGSGEMIALLGPSGCGKTTTLRMIAGLDAPTAGAIRFDGRDVSTLSVQDRNVGMVSQRFALFPHMNVARNVGFGLRVRGLDGTEAARRVDEMLDVVRLSALRHRFPAQLSGGQMQRVALARTLVTRPAVLMMDEPLTNLDTGLRVGMRRFVRGLQRRFAITTIVVTHDQTEALELADRVAVMLDGRVAQFDPPEIVYRRPTSRAVAAFMEAGNVLDGRLAAPDAVETALGRLVVRPRDDLDAGARVGVVLRPEAVILHAARPEGAALAGCVAARDFSGPTVTYAVEVGATRLILREQADRMIDAGAAVWLTIPPERIWLIAG